MKRVMLALAKAGISLGLVAFFLSRVAWEDLREAVASVDVLMWAAAVLLFLASNFLGAFQWRELLRMQDIHLPVRKVVGLYFIGVFFNNFLVSNIGGDAVRIYDLKRLTGRTTPGFAATFLDRFIGLFFLIFFSVIAYGMTPRLWGTALWLPIGTLAGGLLGVLCFGFSRRLSGVALGAGQRVLPDRVVRILEGVRAGFMCYRYAYGMLARVGGLAVGVQLCRVGVYYVTGHALGQDVAFRDCVVFIPLIAIVAAVPVSFGGIGVRENMGVWLFGRVGVAAAPALTMMLLGYLAGIVASLAGGIVFVLRRPERWKAEVVAQER